jgi:hypothetical protein
MYLASAARGVYNLDIKRRCLTKPHILLHHRRTLSVTS